MVLFSKSVHVTDNLSNNTKIELLVHFFISRRNQDFKGQTAEAATLFICIHKVHDSKPGMVTHHHAWTCRFFARLLLANPDTILRSKKTRDKSHVFHSSFESRLTFMILRFPKSFEFLPTQKIQFPSSFVKFEVFTAVTMKSGVFLDATPLRTFRRNLAPTSSGWQKSVN
jgi:hypothetical protein